MEFLAFSRFLDSPSPSPRNTILNEIKNVNMNRNAMARLPSERYENSTYVVWTLVWENNEEFLIWAHFDCFKKLLSNKKYWKSPGVRQYLSYVGVLHNVWL